MKYSPRVVEAFLALVRAGLWAESANVGVLTDAQWKAVFRLADEQTVVGLIGAAMEKLQGERPPKFFRNSVVSTAFSLEQRNQLMNALLEQQATDFQQLGIRPLLIKGQGLAQCYVHPMLRACGDVDYLSMGEDFDRMSAYLLERSTDRDEQTIGSGHQVFFIGEIEVELHRDIHLGLGAGLDRILDELQVREFAAAAFRSWGSVYLPSYQFDVIQVFTHFLKHFFKGGLGLRQICDWCRLLYTGYDALDLAVLRADLERLRLLKEWQVFGAFAVEYLGMPSEKIPFYRTTYRSKAHRVLDFILEVGNFGHNRDARYFRTDPYLLRKTKTFGIRLKDFARHAWIFPMDSIRFLGGMTWKGLKFVRAGR